MSQTNDQEILKLYRENAELKEKLAAAEKEKESLQKQLTDAQFGRIVISGGCWCHGCCHRNWGWGIPAIAYTGAPIPIEWELTYGAR